MKEATQAERAADVLEQIEAAMFKTSNDINDFIDIIRDIVSDLQIDFVLSEEREKSLQAQVNDLEELLEDAERAIANLGA